MEGYGTDQSLLRFRKESPLLKSKVVIYFFYINDFSNNVRLMENYVYKPLFIINQSGSLSLTNVPVPLSPEREIHYPTVRNHKYSGFEKFMRSWSHLYSLYKNRIFDVFRSLRGDYYLEISGYDWWAIERFYRPEMNYSLRITQLLIKEFAREAEQNGGRFLLVIAPNKAHVNTQIQKKIFNTYYNLDPTLFDSKKPYILLEEFAKKENISMINLFSVFTEEIQKGHDPYLAWDDHFNEYGHEIVAREIYNRLIEEGQVQH